MISSLLVLLAHLDLIRFVEITRVKRDNSPGGGSQRILWFFFFSSSFCVCDNYGTIHFFSILSLAVLPLTPYLVSSVRNHGHSLLRNCDVLDMGKVLRAGLLDTGQHQETVPILREHRMRLDVQPLVLGRSFLVSLARQGNRRDREEESISILTPRGANLS